VRRLLVILGVLMIASGLLWAAQGSGLFPYPARSFMIDQTPWIWWGLLMAGAGLAVLWAARGRSGQ
jgi:hypothetical protein